MINSYLMVSSPMSPTGVASRVASIAGFSFVAGIGVSLPAPPLAVSVAGSADVVAGVACRSGPSSSAFDGFDACSVPLTFGASSDFGSSIAFTDCVDGLVVAVVEMLPFGFDFGAEALAFDGGLFTSGFSCVLDADAAVGFIIRSRKLPPSAAARLLRGAGVCEV